MKRKYLSENIRNGFTLTATLVLIFIITSVAAKAQEAGTAQIRLNQLGFYTSGPKKAVVMGEMDQPFFILSAGSRDTVYSGQLKPVREAPYASSKTARLADFTGLEKAGTFVLSVPETGTSHEFVVGSNPMKQVADASLKAYYLMRSSTPLTEAYAGKWARAAGTPDDQVEIHASAATEERPEGTEISAPKGWYDAGDYNKYIVNSGISMATLLSLYEDFPAFMDTVDTNIPESGNQVPDMLDEIVWNLEWMLDMQDPNDGGVYHKLTFDNFRGIVMPEHANDTRYVVQKSTAATLDFAAVMAQAARIYEEYDEAFPGLADSCLAAARDAWQWARQNPEVYYNQNQMNEQYDPDIVTGAYGDGNVSDEFIWARSELYITTGDEAYFDEAALLPDDNMPIPGWPNVRLLGYYSLLRNADALPAAADELIDDLRQNVIGLGDDLVNRASQSLYDTPMGSSGGNFFWGSNSLAGNQAIALLQAYRLTDDPKYLDAAQANLDYLLGRNGTGFSFVTGYGDKTPMNPHHRPSEADNVSEPVPGLVVGGPNASAYQQDGCNSDNDSPDYPSTVPDETYLDHWCSYAANEITINWNAPMVYLAYAMEHYRGGEDQNTATEETGQSPSGFRLFKNYPNPFNPETNIQYVIGESGQISIKVYSLTGRHVSTLVEGYQHPGRYQVTWNATSTSGESLSSGTYLYSLNAEGYSTTRTMTLIK